MTRFVNEHLEVYTDDRGEWYRCAHCEHLFCPTSQDWREGCLERQVLPKQEPIVSDLLGPYSYRQHCCSSCGTLLQTDLITPEGKVIR